MSSKGFWLKSAFFKPELGEDTPTNPGCYGKALAEWISGALRTCGREVEGIVPEDWGWCVVVDRGEFLLWVGCGNVQEEPLPNELTWHCFVKAEVPFWKSWVKISRRAELNAEVTKLNSQLEAAFESEPRIRMVAEP